MSSSRAEQVINALLAVKDFSEYTSVVQETVYLIKELQDAAANRWISVSERTPRLYAPTGISDAVWCYDSNGHISLGIYRADASFLRPVGFAGGDTGNDSAEVLYWMPIPELPPLKSGEVVKPEPVSPDKPLDPQGEGVPPVNPIPTIRPVPSYNRRMNMDALRAEFASLRRSDS